VVLSWYFWVTIHDSSSKLINQVANQILLPLCGDTIHWQRKVPKDLEDRYGGSKLIKVNLKTNDLSRAFKQVDRLSRQYEASCDAMRGNSALTPATVKGQALLLLKKWGLAPYPAGNDEDAVDLFIEKTFQDKREKFAGEMVASTGGDRAVFTLYPASRAASAALLQID
jgi:hypothetical protein